MNAVICYARFFGFGHVLKPLLYPPLTDIRAMILPKRTEFALQGQQNSSALESCRAAFEPIARAITAILRALKETILYQKT
jgi:hypothetical protein